MCKRCERYFTIHDAEELKEYLDQQYPRQKNEILKLWRERGYFSNLVYLEYLSAKKEKK